MTAVLAIIMSVMIFILAILIAGVALLALDNLKEREMLRVILDEIETQEAAVMQEIENKDTEYMKWYYNDIVNRHL